MKKFYRFFFSGSVLLILIYSFLLQGLFLPGVLEIYRFSESNFYIYTYGNFISRSFVNIAFLVSFLYPLIIWLKGKKDFREKLILVFLGVVPALYYAVLYSLSAFV